MRLHCTIFSATLPNGCIGGYDAEFYSSSPASNLWKKLRSGTSPENRNLTPPLAESSERQAH